MYPMSVRCFDSLPALFSVATRRRPEISFLLG